jgi:3-phenylpropionate/trans-cinnamate dioxygenase ferredoxin component
VPWIEVGPVEELPPGSVKLVHAGQITVGVYNLGGEFYAIEDRCSHDDGPLCEGDFEEDSGIVICPRHGANFDIRTGRALTLPAFEPVSTYPVRVVDGIVKVEI